MTTDPNTAPSVDLRFPEAIRELWALLEGDVVWLHGRWLIYRQLFGTNKERVDLLNETLGTVSGILQDVLLHDVQLSLSKIGDPASKGKHANLSLRRLHDVLKDAGEDQVASKLKPLLGDFDTACEQIRYRRNKWIGHNDLVTRISGQSTPLLDASRAEIESALSALRDAMNCIGQHYTGTPTRYQEFVMNQDGEHLVVALAQARRYRELIETGKLDLSELNQCRI